MGRARRSRSLPHPPASRSGTHRLRRDRERFGVLDAADQSAAYRRGSLAGDAVDRVRCWVSSGLRLSGAIFRHAARPDRRGSGGAPQPSKPGDQRRSLSAVAARQDIARHAGEIPGGAARPTAREGKEHEPRHRADIVLARVCCARSEYTTKSGGILSHYPFRLPRIPAWFASVRHT
jgi:hypothetical protein